VSFDEHLPSSSTAPTTTRQPLVTTILFSSSRSWTVLGNYYFKTSLCFKPLGLASTDRRLHHRRCYVFRTASVMTGPGSWPFPDLFPVSPDLLPVSPLLLPCVLAN
jgi:hypothetical protein